MSFAIIGAGVHATAAAHHLARRGHQVSVFERRSVGGGPTGAASGVVRSYYTSPFLAAIAHESTAILADFADQVGGDSGFRQTGGLYLHPADEVGAVTENAAALADLGITNTVLGLDDLAATYPELDLTGVGVGVWEPGAGTADPYRTALSYAARARAEGAEFRTGTEVVAIDDHGTGVTLALSDGTVHSADRLLIAAGPWTAPLAEQVGATLPLTAERHVVAGLRHDDPTLALPYVLIDVVAGYYSRPWHSDGFLLGPLAATAPTDPNTFDPAITDSEFDWLAKQAGRRAAVRASARRDRAADGAAGLATGESWASLYDVSPDWQPVIGRIAEHTFVDAGTSGHGFKLAPVLGDHVARLLLDEPDRELAQFGPTRFDDGALLASGFGAARILG